MFLLPLLYARHCDPTAVPRVPQDQLQVSQVELSEGRIIIRAKIPRLLYLIVITALQGDSLGLRVKVL